MRSPKRASGLFRKRACPQRPPLVVQQPGHESSNPQSARAEREGGEESGPCRTAWGAAGQRRLCEVVALHCVQPSRPIS
jgi:hypothetical protein